MDVFSDAVDEFPILSAHHPDEDSRAARLLDVRQRLRTLGIGGVIRLHDHKGTLHVWWTDAKRATPHFRAVHEAWQAWNEDLVEHRAADGTPIGASEGNSLGRDDAWPVTQMSSRG